MTLLARLLVRTEQRENGCIVWTGPLFKDSHGYGQIFDSVERKPRRVHRVAYEFFVGDIPDGYEIHHLCGTPACINPQHLQAVTHAEHPGAASTLNRAKTHCPQGHEYDYIRPSDGARMCRQCHKDWNERNRALQTARRRRQRQLAKGA